MARFSKSRWPQDGPVRALLAYIDELHDGAGQPSLTEIGRAVALAPSTLSAFFTGARLIGRGNLELLVEYLDGDVGHAEALRRRAVTAWDSPSAPRRAADDGDGDVDPDAPSGADSANRVELIVFEAPVNRLNRPDQLVGRGALVATLHEMLDRGERVVLHGLGGSGKTAVAATVADARIEAAKGPYVWLRPGNADSEAALDAVVRALARSADRDRIKAAVGDARLLAIGDMIRRTDVRLWVIDDVWHPAVLHALLRALPDELPVVVTSRLKLSIGNVVDVGALAPDDALSLLDLHAKHGLGPDAYGLCRDLGYHPYALEIAGRHLRQYGDTPAELRGLLADSPHGLTMPAGLAAPGRESVQRLLEFTYLRLDSPDARRALQSIGAFHSGTITVELLAGYLGFDHLRARAALNALVDASLAKRIPATTAYELHDLTFAYARSLGATGGAAAACAFVAEHVRDYQLLAAELDNLLGVAATARQSEPTTLLSIVEPLAVGGYLDDHGHTLGLLRLLDVAIELVRDDAARCHLLLTKRGNADVNQGEYIGAVALYEQALGLAPTRARRIVLHSVLGKTLAELGRHTEADEQFAQAYAIADAGGDDRDRLRILEQHSVAAFRHKDYQRVRELTAEGLELSRRLGERFQESIFLNNLGTAEFELGVCAAIDLHEQARELAGELNNDHVLALTNRTLGADFHAQENFDRAKEHLSEALRLYGRLGQREREANLRQLMRRFGYLEETTT